VESDLFNPTHSSLLVCLLTSELIEAPLFRLTLTPSPDNGLKDVSQIMVDKLVALSKDRIRDTIGVVDDENLLSLNRSLTLMLGLAGM